MRYVCVLVCAAFVALLWPSSSWSCINDRKSHYISKWHQQRQKRLAQKRRRMSREAFKKWRRHYRKDRQKHTLALVQHLITGRFARHSPSFHRWRIKGRRKKLTAQPLRIDWYDDLAVSYDKLGMYDKAIAAMKKKRAISPGEYKTHANLGTFYIHKAIFAKGGPPLLKAGLAQLKRAVAINARAHYGREIYQILLVEYTIKQQKMLLKYRWPKFCDNHINLCKSFADYVLLQGKLGRRFVSKQYFPSLTKPRALRDAAVRGVLGMMRFGHHDSPILLSALGSLLAQQYGIPGKRMAAQAYLKASMEAKHRQQKRFYRYKMQKLLRQLHPHKNERVRYHQKAFVQLFKRELSRARRWYQRVQKRERIWLYTQKDPEIVFLRTYIKNPKTTSGRLLMQSDGEFSRSLAAVFPISHDWTPPVVTAAMKRAANLPPKQPRGKGRHWCGFSNKRNTRTKKPPIPWFILSLLGLLSLLASAYFWSQYQQKRQFERFLSEL